MSKPHMKIISAVIITILLATLITSLIIVLYARRGDEEFSGTFVKKINMVKRY